MCVSLFELSSYVQIVGGGGESRFTMCVSLFELSSYVQIVGVGGGGV